MHSLYSCKICSWSLRFRQFGECQVNTAQSSKLVHSCLVNKWAKFGTKTFAHFWDIVIFVLGHFLGSRLDCWPFALWCQQLWHMLALHGLSLSDTDTLHSLHTASTSGSRSMPRVFVVIVCFVWFRKKLNSFWFRCLMLKTRICCRLVLLQIFFYLRIFYGHKSSWHVVMVRCLLDIWTDAMLWMDYCVY